MARPNRASALHGTERRSGRRWQLRGGRPWAGPRGFSLPTRDRAGPRDRADRLGLRLRDYWRIRMPLTFIVSGGKEVLPQTGKRTRTKRKAATPCRARGLLSE